MRVGTDIVRVSRMTERIARRILGEGEKIIYHSLGSDSRRREFAAGRFAAKEALIKASGKRGIEFSSIQFLMNEDGSPEPSKEVIALLDGADITVSISHEKEYAVAVIIVF